MQYQTINKDNQRSPIKHTIGGVVISNPAIEIVVTDLEGSTYEQDLRQLPATKVRVFFTNGDVWEGDALELWAKLIC